MTVLFFLAAFLTPGRDVLAVHDSLFRHGGGRRGAGGVTAASCSTAASWSCRSSPLYTIGVYWVFRGKVDRGYG